MAKTSKTTRVLEFEYLDERIKAKTEDAWFQLVDALGNLFDRDDSLRGDLTHTLHYLLSRASGSTLSKPSLNNLDEMVCDFARRFTKAGSGCPIGASFAAQSVGQFIQRQINKPDARPAYTVYLFFLLAVAIHDGEEKFFEHHIHKETGEFSQFLVELHHLVARKEPIGKLVSKVEDFDQRRKSRSQLKYDLGGMISLASSTRKPCGDRFSTKTRLRISRTPSPPNASLSATASPHTASRRRWSKAFWSSNPRLVAQRRRWPAQSFRLQTVLQKQRQQYPPIRRRGPPSRQYDYLLRELKDR